MFSTVTEVLRRRAASEGDRTAFTFLGDAEPDQESITHAGLDARARRIAARLQGLTEAGDRVVLLSPPGLEYIAGFFGCLYAGRIAVPAYPPELTRLQRTVPRLRAIIRDAQATAVLTTSALLSKIDAFSEQAPDLKALRWLATDELLPGAEDAWQPPPVEPDALAFLQYTSGSTGTPKG